MPFYLVRWPNMSASLISARDEDMLFDMLDEVSDPGGCTWKVYRGPVCIDLNVPVRFHFNEGIEGRLRPEDVVFDDAGAGDAAQAARAAEAGCIVENYGLEASAHLAMEAAYEMRRAIYEFAFPHLTREVDAAGDALEEADVRSAVRRDLVDHDLETMQQGVWIDENGRFRRQRSYYYRRSAPGRFELVDTALLDDFCLGLANVKPEPDGLVRVATVAVRYLNRRAESAHLTFGAALRVDATGTIASAHRADAFAADAPGTAGLRQLLNRRNETVQWAPDRKDLRGLAALMERTYDCELMVGE